MAASRAADAAPRRLSLVDERDRDDRNRLVAFVEVAEREWRLASRGKLETYVLAFRVSNLSKVSERYGAAGKAESVLISFYAVRWYRPASSVQRRVT